jgi:hypothetical protein
MINPPLNSESYAKTLDRTFIKRGPLKTKLVPLYTDWLLPGCICEVHISRDTFRPIVVDTTGETHRGKIYRTRKSAVRNAVKLAHQFKATYYSTLQENNNDYETTSY